MRSTLFNGVKITMQKLKGFTIIELLVVVAIIAVLTGIVLVNVTQYINKGKNAAIKGNMSSLLINAAIYYDTDPVNKGTYTAFDTNTATGCGAGSPIALAITAAGGALTCRVSTNAPAGSAWCGCSTELPVTTVFCVDSTGKKIEKLASDCTVATCVLTSGACI